MKPPRHLRRLLPYLARHRKGLAIGMVTLLLRTALSVASPWVLRHAIDDLTLGVTREKLWMYSGLVIGIVALEALFLFWMRQVLIGISREIEYELRNDLYRHLTLLPARYYQSHRTGDLMSRATNDLSAVRMVLVVGIVALEALFLYWMRQVLIGISREIEYELRNDLYRHLTLLPARYYQAHRTGDLMSRATNDLSAVRMVLGPGIMYTASTVTTAIGTIVLMARISPRLLLVSLVPMVFVSVLVRYFGRRIHDRFEAVQAQLSEISAVVQENLSGARVVRAYAQEPYEMARFAQANEEYLRRNRQLIRMYGSLYPGIQVLMGMGSVLVLWLGGRMVVAGTITIGEFVAFGAYLAMLQWPMIALGWVVNIFERGEASMGRMAAILEAPPEIEDRSPLAVTSIRGDVEFRGLTFSYDGKPVLRDIDLVVPAGSTVAVVGPTGSGKSTLVSLIPRLFDAPPGAVRVDGHDVRDLPLSVLRGAVGYVPQETFLFSDTVRENVAFGLGAGGETGERVKWAAEVAQLSKDVADFPKQFDTFVGERGITLSGGQKQRTALARALATDAPILILDDALASVDTQTEEEILRALRGVMATRTTFLVSHRVSTVREADLIVVLKDGRIVERGTHDELIARGGFYADLHRRQLLEEEMEKTA